MKADKLFEIDDKKRKQIGWPAVAWISPEVPKPKTKAEKIAQEICPPKGAYMLHIYTVLELLEQAYFRGLKEGKKQ